MKHTAVAIAMAAVCGLAAATSSAGSIGVGPTRVELDARTHVQALTVQNTGDSPSLLQVDVYRWQQSAEGEVLTPAPEMAATPRVIEIKPGESKTVRVGLRDPKPVQVETAYRLYVREVQSAADGNGPQLRYLVQIGIPVFVSPLAAEGAKSAIAWKLDHTGEGCGQLQVVNDGKRRERVLALDYREQGRSLWRSEVPQYLLAGTHRTIKLPPCDAALARSPGELVFVTESGEQRAARIQPAN